MSRTAVESQDTSWFFNRVSAATDRVLFVDYDGTVAPFHPDRHRAIPYPKVPEYLRCIMTSCNTRLIMVSGRAAHEVPYLLGLNPPPEIWGTHGIERIHSDGRYEEVRVSEDALHLLAQAEKCLDREGFGKHVEVKLAGVALHWRGLSPSDVLNIRTKAYRILQPLAIEPDLVLAEFEGGLELRLASANKGEALRRFLAELPANIPVAYLGDDSTDEDAFRVLDGRGLSVLVGLKPRTTAARLWLKPPDEVIQFLTAWIHACGEKQ